MTTYILLFIYVISCACKALADKKMESFQMCEEGSYLERILYTVLLQEILTHQSSSRIFGFSLLNHKNLNRENH